MSSEPKKISIIIPVHNESPNIEWHFSEIKKTIDKLSGYSFEIIYIDDGSTDDSLLIIKKLAKKYKVVHYHQFSRNFGKEAATSAGLKTCTGDAAVMIDADGQHPIEILNEFLNKWTAGYEVIVGVRHANNGEGVVKHYGSKIFYKTLNKLTNDQTIPGSTDYRLLDRKVVDEFNKLTERSRITRGLIDWLGFKRATVVFTANARYSGEATYRFGKLVKLAIHGFISQTTKPLQLTGVLGAFVTLSSAIVGIALLIETYVFNDALKLGITGSGFIALFVSFLVGIVLICQWLLALYIESIHGETQNRPLYIISESDELLK